MTRLWNLRLAAVGLALSVALIAAPAASAQLAGGNPVSLTATVGSAFSGEVASFTDDSPYDFAAEFMATIAWGDGTQSVGSIVPGATPGSFVVDGTHTYSSAGNFLTSVNVEDIDGSSLSLPGSASVAQAPPATTTPNPSLSLVQATGIPAAAGTAFNVLIAVFKDQDPVPTAGQYQASISWGDGSSSSGAVVSASSPGEFGITGAHTYAAQGTYAVRISLTGPSGTSLAITSSATVAAAPLGSFALELGRASSDGPHTLAVRVGCPRSETSCRGVLSAVEATGRHQVLSTVIFILAGGKSAELDLMFSAATTKRLDREHGSLIINAVAFDPAKKRVGQASETARRLHIRT
jgi:hypothetical protein